jgi:hypothetical protein
MHASFSFPRIRILNVDSIVGSDRGCAAAEASSSNNDGSRGAGDCPDADPAPESAVLACRVGVVEGVAGDVGVGVPVPSVIDVRRPSGS